MRTTDSTEALAFSGQTRRQRVISFLLSPRGAPGGRSLPPSSPPAPQRVQVPVDRVAAVNFTVAEPREQKFD